MTHVSTQSGQLLKPGSPAAIEIPAGNHLGLRLLNRNSLLDKVGISRSTLYRLTKPGDKKYDPAFPVGKPLSSVPAKNSPLFWLEVDVDVWMLSKMGKTI